MSRFGNRETGGAAVPASQPQQAVLNQSVTDETWDELLNYSSGGGFLHHVIARGHKSSPTGIDRTRVEIRISIDGQTAVELENTGPSGSLRSFASGDAADERAKHYFLGVRFSSSVVVEVRRSNSAITTVHALAEYSTDI